ncbi:hypothetical protein TrVE_jg5732 [Triparma verrucosa]|uniref:Uncharacterized protein n=1 Tax=Triparma verrucosa TaxID=1606542 RepID=A0A9W6ZA28_9STRA|nr:hypothetical protein TrVE_jg5732 [Triparma verrucosa]
MSNSSSTSPLPPSPPRNVHEFRGTAFQEAPPAPVAATTHKTCKSDCKALKPLSAFTKDKKGKGGQRAHCKACMKEKRKWRIKKSMQGALPGGDLLPGTSPFAPPLPPPCTPELPPPLSLAGDGSLGSVGEQQCCRPLY